MPNNSFEIHIVPLPRFCGILNLGSIPLVQKWKEDEDELTISSHPTRRPPPIPFPFRNLTGRFVHLAITRQPFWPPKDESFVLSA
jgi:hypothetical protein